MYDTDDTPNGHANGDGDSTPGRPKKRYTTAERATALAALVLNQGNLTMTARQIGIPESTLREWDAGESEVAQKAKAQLGGTVKQLADRAESIAWRALAVAYEKLHLLDGYRAALVAGILVDKLLLLRGQATVITAVATVEHPALVGKTAEELRALRAKMIQQSQSVSLGAAGLAPQLAAPEAPASLPDVTAEAHDLEHWQGDAGRAG